MAPIFKYVKIALLTVCVFIIYVVIFFSAVPDRVTDTVPLVASIAATALTVFLYTKIAKKVGL